MNNQHILDKVRFRGLDIRATSCPHCGGALQLDAAEVTGDDEYDIVAEVYDCQRCGLRVRRTAQGMMPVGRAVPGA